jgi:hypothetical protein
MRRLLADLREPVLLVTSLGEQVQQVALALAAGMAVGWMLGVLLR